MTDDQHETSAAATAVTTPSDREIVTERVFEARRERVFAAYTDPELIPEWWGPRGVTTTVDQMDLRPGGGRDGPRVRAATRCLRVPRWWRRRTSHPSRCMNPSIP